MRVDGGVDVSPDTEKEIVVMYNDKTKIVKGDKVIKKDDEDGTVWTVVELTESGDVALEAGDKRDVALAFNLKKATKNGGGRRRKSLKKRGVRKTKRSRKSRNTKKSKKSKRKSKKYPRK